ncbi:glycoside hydrolase family 18 protein [Gelatoporia subvermispora B]|uniref:Glycoside hydrolase family 18 protein n=1 Tax=Ceriporiopsis subvermispora (strain B) TaxID=914234 RepID=M2RPI8_CERS8|nr:glycoside hydrolase family 18 protein [Gelatoporia subvermispora B]
MSGSAPSPASAFLVTNTPSPSAVFSGSSVQEDAVASTTQPAAVSSTQSNPGPPVTSISSSGPQASIAQDQPSSMPTGQPSTTANAPPSSPSALNQSTQVASSNASDPARPLIMAYYPDWAADTYPPEKIDFGRLDWIDFAFAVPDGKFDMQWDGSDDAPELLTRLVTAAHASGTKVKLSVGGWTGSKYFSKAVGNDTARGTLADNIVALYDKYNLDGIDIDWEYPGQDGNDGNTVDPLDSQNFLTFLQLLRTGLPPGAKITAAVQDVPFADTDGNPMRDVSDFARVLDWVLLMNYDTWGSSSTPGPNAPLADSCGNSTQTANSAEAALTAWTSAGFPAAQLALGVPSYGYISKSSVSSLRTRSQHTDIRRGHRHRHRRRGEDRDPGLARERRQLFEMPGSTLAEVAAPDSVRASGSPPYEGVVVKDEDGKTSGGQIQFRELVAQGALEYVSDAEAARANASSSAPTRLELGGAEIRSLYAGWSGFVRMWDACSSTPFLRSPGAQQVVTYDDPLSLGLKAAFVRQTGMRGVNIFDVTGDTDQWDLVDALRMGLGLVSVD